MTAADPIRQALQRAYESHCADGYVVPDDETGPQAATGATESDEIRVQALGDGEAPERRTEGQGVTAAHHPIACMDHWDRCCCWCGRHNMWAAEARAHAEADEGVERKAARVLWETSRRDEGTISATGADIAARALADAGLLVSEDTRGALDETLDDLTRTLARAEKAEAEVERLRESVRVDREVIDSIGRDADRWRRIHMFTAKGASRVQADLTAERDRARDTAAALEAENARLRREREFRERAEARARRAEAKVERVEVLAYQLEEPVCSCLSCETQDAVARDIRRALSDTTGEATSETRAGAGVYGRLPGRLCDPDGWVRSGFWHHGTDYQCTGSAHLGSTEIVCTNPVHDQPDTTGEATR